MPFRYFSTIKNLYRNFFGETTNIPHLILDCLKFDKHPTHFNIQEALYVSNMLKPKKTILTNLHYDLDYNSLLKRLPPNVVPAYDGLTINL